VLRPKASWGWRLFSTTMKEPRRGVRRPGYRLSSVRTWGSRRRTGHRTRSIFYLQPLGPGARWENVVTVRSTRLARMYEPGVWAPRIGPKPLMMIVATQDTVTLTDLALEAYERAHQPKKLVMIPGGHFDPYLSGFKRVVRRRIAMVSGASRTLGRFEMPLVSLQGEGPVAVITLENPPQNRINETVGAELADAIDKIEAGEFRAVLLRANGPDFSFGGDIMNWPDMTMRQLRATFDQYMSIFKPL